MAKQHDKQFKLDAASTIRITKISEHVDVQKISASDTKPFVTVERKTVPGVCVGNWFTIDQRRFALVHFFLGLPISLAVAEAILNFFGSSYPLI